MYCEFSNKGLPPLSHLFHLHCFCPTSGPHSPQLNCLGSQLLYIHSHASFQSYLVPSVSTHLSKMQSHHTSPVNKTDTDPDLKEVSIVPPAPSLYHLQPPHLFSEYYKSKEPPGQERVHVALCSSPMLPPELSI